MAAASLFLLSCSVDTELGVAAELSSASVDVASVAEGDVLSVTVTVDVRVGEHAAGDHDFAVFRATVVMDGSQVGQVPLDRPERFDPTLSPGETRTITTIGRSQPGAFPDARARLCGGATGVTVLVHVRDDTTGETSIAEGAASGVSCD